MTLPESAAEKDLMATTKLAKFASFIMCNYDLISGKEVVMARGQFYDSTCQEYCCSQHILWTEKQAYISHTLPSYWELRNIVISYESNQTTLCMSHSNQQRRVQLMFVSYNIIDRYDSSTVLIPKIEDDWIFWSFDLFHLA